MISNSGDNQIAIHPSVNATGSVKGNGNIISITKSTNASNIKININGNNNKIIINNPLSIKDLVVACGNHIETHSSEVLIGNNFSIEPNSKFLIFQSGCKLSIGEDCMFSSDIVVRLGEQPHLIFDLDSNEYNSGNRELIIGNHVWIGERCYITKSAKISDDCITAACAVVTRKFDEKNVVIGGNPATIIKRNIKWLRNSGSLKFNPAQHKSYNDYQSKFTNKSS